MCGSGILPGWTRPCRPSDLSSPVSGKFTSENTVWNINTVASHVVVSCNHPVHSLHECTGWLCMFAKVYTHTHEHTCWASLSPMLTVWHPLFSFKLSLSEADGWAIWVFVCLNMFILCFTEASKIRFFFWFWESVGWAGADLRLLTDIYATFNLITMWSSSWASYRKLGYWSPLFLSLDAKKGN